MTESPTAADAPAGAEGRGILCRACGNNSWKVTMSRKCMGTVRRWRTCLRCRHRVRTAERIEADGYGENRGGESG
jgi:hypothetical protein